jgi:hypothetical protein
MHLQNCHALHGEGVKARPQDDQQSCLIPQWLLNRLACFLSFFIATVDQARRDSLAGGSLALELSFTAK